MLINVGEVQNLANGHLLLIKKSVMKKSTLALLAFVLLVLGTAFAQNAPKKTPPSVSKPKKTVARSTKPIAKAQKTVNQLVAKPTPVSFNTTATELP